MDDHAVVRAGYRRFLEQEPGCAVSDEASSGEEAYVLLQKRLPDLMILDLSMPGQGGLATLRRIKQRWPLLPVLVFSMHDGLPFAIQALRSGANGYVTKSSDPAVLVKSVREVMAGRLALSPDLAARLARAGSAREQPTLGLSVREFDIFRLLAAGRSHEEIAAALNVSAKTVANNHSLIRQKLGISSDIELLRLAEASGVADPAPPSRG
ncbi:MAG TPA: response regulator transcription factor [Steroidobacteraceae bacterium]|nr:response regulator transcription factor [Steroidobacteraceae bacterium]